MKPRILFIIPSDYGELMKKGVGFILKEREEGDFFERIVTVHPSAHRTQIVDLSPVQRLYEFHEALLPFVSRLKLFRYPQHVFHVLRVVLKIVRLIDKENIHMIRATEPDFTGLLAWLVTLIRPRPFCVSIHADYDKRYELDPTAAPTFLGSRALARRLERFVLSRADLVLPIRASLGEMAVAYGVDPHMVRVIPHGVELDPFRQESRLSVAEKLGLPASKKILSFVGRLSKENYAHDIVALAVELKKKRADFTIVMAGDGPEKQMLEAAVRSNGLGDVFKLIGFQPRHFVIALRKQSAVSLCLMGGYSLIEAGAAGRPIVAYDVEWHSELVKNGETGFLIAEKDVAALVDRVEFLLDHPTDAAAMGKKAAALAFQRHDIQSVSALKKACYQELYAKARPAAA